MKSCINTNGKQFNCICTQSIMTSWIFLWVELYRKVKRSPNFKISGLSSLWCRPGEIRMPQPETILKQVWWAMIETIPEIKSSLHYEIKPVLSLFQWTRLWKLTALGNARLLSVWEISWQRIKRSKSPSVSSFSHLTESVPRVTPGEPYCIWIILDSHKVVKLFPNMMTSQVLLPYQIYAKV